MNKRGKITILVLVLILISIGIFSLYYVFAQTTNTKTYDAETQTIAIKEGSNEIAKIKLNTPLVHKVIRGKDRLVAEFTIENNVISSNVFNDMEFYDVKNNMNKFNRPFTYKYKNFYGVEVQDYEIVCKERTAGNGSIEKYDCIKNEIGSHIEQKFNWLIFNKNADLPKGNITIGIFIDVLPNERVEWIPTLFDVKIEDWAVWEESLNEGIKAFWKLNESSGTVALDSVRSLYNATFSGLDLGNTTAKIGTSVKFGDDTDTLLMNKTLINTTTNNFTLSFWYWYNSATTAENDFLWQMIGTPECIIRKQASANSFLFQCWSGSTQFSFSQTLTANDWNHIVIQSTNDGSGNGTVWIDGIIIGSDSSVSMDYSSINNHNFGRTMLVGNSARGNLDEVGWWDRYLTPQEIQDLFNNGSGITFQSIFDATPPNTTTPVIMPIIPKTNQSLECNATLTDNIQTNLTAFWKWYKNNELNLSGTTINIQNGSINASITTLHSGNTTKGEQWICEITPFDGFNNGTAKNSSSVTIVNSVPIHNNPKLTTSTGKNLSTENIICNNQTTSDVDNDNIVNIYNWYKDSQSISVLNLPFEINADDYSGNNNDGLIEGAVFTNGQIGGALEFDGVNDFVNLSRPTSLVNLDTTLSVEAWIFSDNNTGQHLIFDDCEFFATEGYCLLLLDNEFRFHVGLAGAPRAVAGGIQTGRWYHVIGTYDNESIKIYVNGTLINTTSAVGPLNKNGDEDIILGHNSPSQTNNFDGKIDEVRVYNIALTAEQVNQRFEETKDGLTVSSTIVSEETSGGDVWMCQVTPNDGEVDGVTLNSTDLNVLWSITFNVTSGETGEQLPNFNIDCNNTFSVSGVNSQFTTGFEPGNYECTFSKNNFFNKTKTFVADSDKTVSVPLSLIGALTIEEHTWLEAIYNCVILKDCSLYNLLLEINQTTGNIWEHTKPTDESVITFENVTNKVVNASNNLTIDYRVAIPIKAGYSLGTYLPVRIGFWFMNTSNTTCFNQGDKPTGVEDPYCQPLITEVIGPMGGSVNFTVELRPSLPAGNYSIKRIIDIDPNNVWVNYGQENIGIFTLTKSISDAGIVLEKTGEINPSVSDGGASGITGSSSGSSGGGSGGTTIIKEKETIKLVPSDNSDDNKEDSSKEATTSEDETSPGITGGVIGASLLSGGQIVIITIVLAITFIVFIIVTSRTIIRIKKK